MTDSAFYSDRLRGSKPRTSEHVPQATWAGIASLIERRIEDNWLANEFPIHCPDGNGIADTNLRDFRDSIGAHIPNLSFPLDRDEVPDLLDLMDLIDFVGQRIAMPASIRWHSYFAHNDLAFDKTAGAKKFNADIELLFARGGLAFTVDAASRVQRLGPPEVRQVVADLNPNTSDPTLDDLIKDARVLFLSRDIVNRRRALEKLWDAFERLKTLEPGQDKKRQVAALLDRAATGELRRRLDVEAVELTSIGNSMQIRHFETGKEAVPDDTVDYLYTRLASLMLHLLRATGRLT